MSEKIAEWRESCDLWTRKRVESAWRMTEPSQNQRSACLVRGSGDEIDVVTALHSAFAGSGECCNWGEPVRWWLVDISTKQTAVSPRTGTRRTHPPAWRVP